jgi:branched-chain amino acid transport system ATP-binding protein
VLEVRGLVAGYGSLDVLHDVSIAVGDGEWVAVIGANGAGKSTLLNAILGTVSRRGGSIVHDDVHLETMRPADVVRRGIVLVPEGRHVFSDMTVEDNLALGTYTRRGAGRAGIAADLARSYALFPVLHERRRQLAGTLSGGEQQMLAIARALMASPTTLLLDEPSLGLAPLVVDEIYRGLAALHADGTSIVLVEQNVTLALEAVQRAYVMANGAIVSSGRAADLLADPVVREAYLGVRRDKY